MVTINNIPVAGLKSFIKILYKFHSLSPVRIEVQRNNTGNFIFHINPELMLLKIDWIFTFLLACTLVFTGVFLLFYLHDQKYYPFVIALFLYLLSICVRPFSYENIYSLLLMNTGNFSVWMLLFFAFYYPYPRFHKKVRVIIICTTIFFYSILCSIACFFYCTGGNGSDIWFVYITRIEKIRSIFDTGAVVLFFILLIHSYVKSRSLKIKRQIAWIIAGFILAFSPYFFFEHLPFIIGNILGEHISLGNFAHIFICIFPVFFLIGASDVAREKYTSFIPQSIYFFIIIPLFLFLFLLIAKPFYSYLMSHYGFSHSLAYLFFAFLYLLFMLPVILAGIFFMKKIFSKQTHENSLQYIASLKNENSELKEKYYSQLQYNRVKLQTDKIKELSEIVKGIYKRMRKGSNIIAKSLLLIKKKTGVIMSQVEESHSFEESKLQENKNDLYNVLGIIIEENMKIRELIEQINTRFDLKPSFPSWTGVDYIMQQTKREIQRVFPEASVIIKSKAIRYFYCHPSDITQALFYIITFLLETIQNKACDDIIIKTGNDENKLWIKVEFKNSGIDYGNLKNIFHFYTKQGQKGLGLYISRLLVEKNSGSIAAYYSDDGINFILLFSLKNPVLECSDK
ncbi:MAG: hypothetical protein JXB88_12860 [Spirochaetales bacterium]|nr:hypothetical protein [Spirochaetales bacterium]